MDNQREHKISVYFSASKLHTLRRGCVKTNLYIYFLIQTIVSKIAMKGVDERKPITCMKAFELVGIGCIRSQNTSCESQLCVQRCQPLPGVLSVSWSVASAWDILRRYVLAGCAHIVTVSL